jgi:hypothetical protein
MDDVGVASRAIIPRFAPALKIMIETNPIAARIADLTSRVASLRGYL